jgi:nucleosome binding factor SPN SPT16 subunit
MCPPPKFSQKSSEHYSIMPSTTVQISSLSNPRVFVEGDDDENEITFFFSYNGKKYGYDEENTLFVMDENGAVEIVGTWDPEAKKPVFSKD